jgi:hypothetical protein
LHQNNAGIPGPGFMNLKNQEQRWSTGCRYGEGRSYKKRNPQVKLANTGKLSHTLTNFTCPKPNKPLLVAKYSEEKLERLNR